MSDSIHGTFVWPTTQNDDGQPASEEDKDEDEGNSSPRNAIRRMRHAFSYAEAKAVEKLRAPRT